MQILSALTQTDTLITVLAAVMFICVIVMSVLSYMVYRLSKSVVSASETKAVSVRQNNELDGGADEETVAAITAALYSYYGVTAEEDAPFVIKKIVRRVK